MIIHVCKLDKFIPPFIELFREEFSNKDNFFYVIGDKQKHPYTEGHDTKHHSPQSLYFDLLIKMYRADKIILHSLFNIYVVVLLALNPWLLKKCYWVMWGGDYFSFKLDARNFKWHIKELFRRPVIKRIAYLITYIDGSVDLARSWYNAKGEYLKCLAYTSNTVKDLNIKEKKHSGVNILLGNSAFPTNHHLEALDIIARKVKGEEIRIYSPLSYGSEQYAETVIAYGEKLFGSNFIPLRNFLSYEQYLNVLSEIDIAIFNHRRQQAMGNMITLLSMGKKVYMRSDVKSWDMFQSKGIKLFDINYLNFNVVNCSDALKNNKIKVSKEFSRNKLIQQWSAILDKDSGNGR